MKNIVIEGGREELTEEEVRFLELILRAAAETKEGPDGKDEE